MAVSRIKKANMEKSREKGWLPQEWGSVICVTSLEDSLADEKVSEGHPASMADFRRLQLGNGPLEPTRMRPTGQSRVVAFANEWSGLTPDVFDL